MSYFNSLQGEQDLGNFDGGGGNFDPIPDGTAVLAMIDEIKWDKYADQDKEDWYVNARWTVVAPEDYKNRKIFHKLRIEDADENKRNRAIRMLGAIDANAGGKIVAAGVKPTNEAMQAALMNKPMMLKVGVWEINDKKGNWVQAVSPYQRQQQAPVQAPTPPVVAPQTAPVGISGFDDGSIPF